MAISPFDEATLADSLIPGAQNLDTLGLAIERAHGVGSWRERKPKNERKGWRRLRPVLVKKPELLPVLVFVFVFVCACVSQPI